MTLAVDAAVIGGGIAGIAAATALVERHLTVELVESEGFLGGRAASWHETLSDGTVLEMERGFHAFFRQYYGLRSLLRRVDPELANLQPLDDYPILGPNGAQETFSKLPRTAPLNIIELTRRTPTLGLRDLMKIDARAAMRMLAFDGERTYSQYDDMSAEQYLDALRFPPAARRMLFDVFAHSFFNPESVMSAGELLMMFHFYFMGNREGLIFDVCKRPMSTAFWRPFEDYLQARGAKLRLTQRAHRIERTSAGWRVVLDGGEIQAQNVVLAVTATALKSIVANSPDLQEVGASAWAEQIAGLDVTNPFAVWRLWLDQPTRPGRHPFVGTTGMGCIDNISLYHLFQDESRQWAKRTGGSVVEFHAYAVEDKLSANTIKRDLLQALHSLYPETRAARTLDERFLLRRDCPAFARGSHAICPTVETPHRGLFVAGDLVKLPFPSALMERATSSGFIAANAVLAGRGLGTEPVASISPRGILAGLMRGRSPLRPQMER